MSFYDTISLIKSNGNLRGLLVHVLWWTLEY